MSTWINSFMMFEFFDPFFFSWNMFWKNPQNVENIFRKNLSGLFSSAVVFQNLIFLNIFLLEKSEAIKLQLNTREGHYLDICTHLISSMHFYLIFYTIWNCNQCIKLVINTWIYNWNVEKLGLSVSFLFIHT